MARETALRKRQTARRPTRQADLERDLDKQFGPNAVARGREVFAANCARCHSSIPETRGRRFKNRDFRAMDANGVRARLDGLGSGDARDRSRHESLPRAALESHERPRLAGVRLGDAARARARSQHQGTARRRPRLLSQHFAAVRLGARAVHAQQRGRPGALRTSRRTRRTTSTALPTSTRTARRCRRDKAPACWPTTRASTDVSSCTSPR